jgi:hypothetical protein
MQQENEGFEEDSSAGDPPPSEGGQSFNFTYQYPSSLSVEQIRPQLSNVRRGPPVPPSYTLSPANFSGDGRNGGTYRPTLPLSQAMSIVDSQDQFWEDFYRRFGAPEGGFSGHL